ncbi:MAG TPA: class I SAM-dependent methyltransferase [Gammaproteobacteria bacterium]|nr:class I SAM-dependent methyltransferase [Gammaproteobacteria bacterium]
MLTFPALVLATTTSLDTQFSQLPITPLGIQATAAGLDNLTALLAGPPKSDTGKSLLTVNKMGFDVLNNTKTQQSWIILDILDFLKTTKSPILDVGCGYGQITLKALATGNTVIANDVATEHLLQVRKSALEAQLPIDSLYLSKAAFPDLPIPDNALDAVVLHRILHFLPPAQVELGFANVKKWLAPGGKVFIVVMAPQHKEFSSWFLPLYEQKWACPQNSRF